MLLDPDVLRSHLWDWRLAEREREREVGICHDLPPIPSPTPFVPSICAISALLWTLPVCLPSSPEEDPPSSYPSSVSHYGNWPSTLCAQPISFVAQKVECKSRPGNDRGHGGRDTLPSNSRLSTSSTCPSSDMSLSRPLCPAPPQSFDPAGVSHTNTCIPIAHL
ncbi:uncharacterized protein CCOS01_07900 [Colletotrichum costaricense]|uniref:Uncharacterized protein n=1 Tax=Colletotrichum costaricense TaxID=1209916 RepID=A0AAI9YXV7_9PEZI|nr:uncharacterized protein CCOS01_07900 [Colletotrichum costaricense]KAK1527638.1 hypothetical protein CCOS01_07900 [Colletotrichum costaricense]